MPGTSSEALQIIEEIGNEDIPNTPASTSIDEPSTSASKPSTSAKKPTTSVNNSAPRLLTKRGRSRSTVTRRRAKTKATFRLWLKEYQHAARLRNTQSSEPQAIGTVRYPSGFKQIMSLRGMDEFEASRYISLKNVQWLYRGEGNANLVIFLPKDKIILRMQKCEYDVIINRRLIQQREIKLLRDVKFHETVMVPLLGSSFVQPPLLARISESEIIEIDKVLYKIRPRYRLNKGVRFSLITAHPDYTRLPPNLTYSYLMDGLDILSSLPNKKQSENITYCVEIKPKQGWIPMSDRHHPKCTFCSNQYLKFRKQRVLRISQYCPLDLFSGNITRMKRALKSLLKTPQNNLKIFEDGNLIYSEDCHKDYIEIIREFMEPGSQEINSERLLEKWCALLQEALVKQLTEEPPYHLLLQECKDSEINENNSNISNLGSPLEGLIPCCDWSSQPLPENCILQRILMIQKLQKSSFSNIYKTYCDRRDNEEDYAYAEKLLTSNKPLDPIQRYLLAATARDCSIFIALQRCLNKKNDNKLHYITDFDGINYRMNIGISDIDPKPLSCIEKHAKRDNEVLSAILYFKNSKLSV